MINLKGEGKIIQHIASGAILSGGVVVLVNRIGIAMEDIADTITGSVLVEGEVEVTKVSAQAWVIGDPIFWDASASKFTTVGTAGIIAGYAARPAANPSSTGRINLAPGTKQMPVQADTVAADLAALKVDFNLLLGKLKAAGSMANS